MELVDGVVDEGEVVVEHHPLGLGFRAFEGRVDRVFVKEVEEGQRCLSYRWNYFLDAFYSCRCLRMHFEAGSAMRVRRGFDCYISRDIGYRDVQFCDVHLAAFKRAV